MFCAITSFVTMFSKIRLKVENIVSKGEIARFEQFLLLPLCFQKPSAAEASESVYMRERVNPYLTLKSYIIKTSMVVLALLIRSVVLVHYD